jgi:UDP-glucose 4-epimerase
MAPRTRRRQTIVVTGIASRFGRLLARMLRDHYRIIGIDERGAHHMPADVTVHALDLRRRKAEDIFRRNQIDAVIHLVPEPTRRTTDGRRMADMVGAHRVFEYCQKNNVPKIIVLSTANVYGPAADNNQFLTEESPLLAGQRFPTMREFVEIDMYAQTWFWRRPECETVILRPVNIVGRIGNAASRYLSLNPVPTLLGFDPMVQVIAPEDVVRAIECALVPGVRGVFNVAGPGALPLRELIRRLGRTAVPVLDPIARMLIGALSGAGLSAAPSAELDYLKYICMVDDHRARATLGYEPRLTLDETLAPLRG